MPSSWVRWIRTKSASSSEATANAAYAAPGYLLFCRDKTLLAQRFDLKRFALTGEPTTILTEIQQLPQVGRAVFAASDDGLLVAQTGSQVALSQPTLVRS